MVRCVIAVYAVWQVVGAFVTFNSVDAVRKLQYELASSSFHSFFASSAASWKSGNEHGFTYDEVPTHYNLPTGRDDPDPEPEPADNADVEEAGLASSGGDRSGGPPKSLLHAHRGGWLKLKRAIGRARKESASATSLAAIASAAGESAAAAAALAANRLQSVATRLSVAAAPQLQRIQGRVVESTADAKAALAANVSELTERINALVQKRAPQLGENLGEIASRVGEATGEVRRRVSVAVGESELAADLAAQYRDFQTARAEKAAPTPEKRRRGVLRIEAATEPHDYIWSNLAMHPTSRSVRKWGGALGGAALLLLAIGLDVQLASLLFASPPYAPGAYTFTDQKYAGLIV